VVLKIRCELSTEVYSDKTLLPTPWNSEMNYVLYISKKLLKRELFMKWADQFCEVAKAEGLNCIITNRVNGWPESIIISGKKCFVKSMTYNVQRNLYFQGVDPKKLEGSGDLVLLCGGLNSELRDIFLGSSPNRVGKMHLIGFNKVKYISGIYYFNRLKNLS